jgi:hypothetical protein
MWNRLYWRDVAERALSTAAQAALGLLIADGGTVYVGLLDVDWPAALAVVGSATLASVLQSIAATQIGDPYSASLVVGAVPVRDL